VHLVGFITKKFVTMHGHMDVKFVMNFVISKEEPNSEKLPSTKFHVNLSAVYVLFTEYAGRQTDVMKTHSRFLCKYSSQMRHESFVLGSACCVCAWPQVT
jgi:hypothetical protein